MPLHRWTLQPINSGVLPFSLWVALLAFCSALGIVLRQVAIPTFSPYVNLTPGFVMPLMAGMLLGPLGGGFCGIFVGMSGAFWEPFLIPLIGNIALGLSTGLPSYFRYKAPQSIWVLLCIVFAIIIGGFLPTFTVEVFVARVFPPIAAFAASIDAAQAGLWASVALLVLRGIIDPLLKPYQHSVME